MSTETSQRPALAASAPPPWALLSELTASPGVWAPVTGPVGNQSAVAISSLLRGEGLQVAARPERTPEGLWLLWARAPMEGLPDLGPARTALGGAVDLAPAPSAPAPAPTTRATPTATRKPAAAKPAAAKPAARKVPSAGGWCPPPVPAELVAAYAGMQGGRSARVRTRRELALVAAHHINLHTHLNQGVKGTGAWLGINPTTVKRDLALAAEQGLFTITHRNIWPARGNVRLHGEMTPAGIALLTLPERKATGLLPAGQPVPVAPAPASAPPVRPTAAQREAIERLRVGNRASDQALASRRPEPAVRATLPATCTPITSAQLPAFLRHWGKSAEAAGWALGRQGDGHHRWVGPDGQVVTSNATSPDRGTTRGNAVARLRRAGVPTP